MIAAVDAPCVCLNCAVHLTGPVSGVADADIELDVELELEVHAAIATSVIQADAWNARMDPPLEKEKGGAELELRSAFQFCWYRFSVTALATSPLPLRRTCRALHL